MKYVLQSVQSEDTIQLFEPSPPSAVGTPKTGLAHTDVAVFIRKAGEAGYSLKTITALDWEDRGDGNYALQFTAANFDTIGQFRYRISPVTGGDFVIYDDDVIVVEEIPVLPAEDPPVINLQTDSPPGLSPNPVQQGTTLSINGQNLLGASEVKIGGVVVPITANTNDQIQVTVTKPVPPGTPGVPIGSHVVEVTTPGGTVSPTTLLKVILNIADLPGSGFCVIHGTLYDWKTNLPAEGIGVFARLLDMPNLGMGIGWSDDTKTVATNSNGYFEIEVPRKVKIELSIPRDRYRRILIVPDAARADYISEIP